MKVKRILSTVLGVGILMLVIGASISPKKAITVQGGNVSKQIDISDKNATFPSGTYQVSGENGEVINVIIADKCDGMISVGDVTDIINDNAMKSGEKLTFYDIGTTYAAVDGKMVEKYDINQTSNDIMPQWRWYDLLLTTETSWYYGGEYVAKDVFVASAARGEIYKLTSKFSSSLSFSCEAGATFSDVKATIGAKTSVSYEAEKSHQYSGPDRSSKYNSTEYRVKFYAKKCYVTQKVTGWPSDHTDTYTATFVCPQRYFSYSIDHLV